MGTVNRSQHIFATVVIHKVYLSIFGISRIIAMQHALNLRIAPETEYETNFALLRLELSHFIFRLLCHKILDDDNFLWSDMHPFKLTLHWLEPSFWDCTISQCLCKSDITSSAYASRLCATVALHALCYYSNPTLDHFTRTSIMEA